MPPKYPPPGCCDCQNEGLPLAGCRCVCHDIFALELAGEPVPDVIFFYEDHQFADPENFPPPDPYANYAKETGRHHPECQCNLCSQDEYPWLKHDDAWEV